MPSRAYGSSRHELASATRCRYVNIATGSDAPAMFPSSGVMTWRPLLSTGSLRTVVPPLRRYYRALRLPAVRLDSLRILHPAYVQDEGSPRLVISGLNHTTFNLAVASQGGSPHRHARLASGCWPGFARRDSYPLGSNERFPISSPFLLSQAFLTQGHHIQLKGRHYVWCPRNPLPKSAMGKAVTYARNQWAALRRYVTDGRLTIDRHQRLGTDAAEGRAAGASRDGRADRVRASGAAVEDRPAIGEGGRPLRARGAERRGRPFDRRSRLGGLRADRSGECRERRPCLVRRDATAAIDRGVPLG
jgi:Transposase IS66 family